MKSIFILLTTSDTYVSKVIKLMTADTYTHVSISFNESLQPLYSFSRKHIHIPLPAGIHIEAFNHGFFKKYDYIPCALYELTVEDEVYEDAKKQVEAMMSKADSYHYNVLGLLLCKLGIPFQREHYCFCSEFVGNVLIRSNALTLPKKPPLMRPIDYTNIPNLSCLYEGQLNGLVKQRSMASGL